VCHKFLRVQSVALAESPHANRILGVKTAENYATGFRAYVRSSGRWKRVAVQGVSPDGRTLFPLLWGEGQGEGEFAGQPHSHGFSALLLRSPQHTFRSGAPVSDPALPHPKLPRLPPLPFRRGEGWGEGLIFRLPSSVLRRGEGWSGKFGVHLSAFQHFSFSLIPSPRYTHLAVQVSATTTSVRSGSFGLSWFQIQTAMFSLVGFSRPGTSFR